MTDIAIFWDASQLWGLLVWRAAEAFGLPYRLVKAKEIAQGALSDKTSLLLVPGGTARHKSAALGEKGRDAVRAYTNLALLLSDQCEVTTKVAIFQGTDKAIFRDRKEFSGSIIKQLDDVFQFIDLNNKTKASFSGLERIDKRDYPEEAVRESLLNSIVHRDYSFSGSNLINIYDDRMEFVSLGGLVSGLELDSIFLGVSQPRNPNLAAIFYRMMLIESYGTGIGKIQRAYKDFSKQPVFETAKGVFRVTLPNRNEMLNHTNLPKKRIVAVYRQPSSLTEKQLILEYVNKNKKITRKEAEAILNSGTTKAFKLLKELCTSGELQAIRSGKNTYYTSV